MRKIREYGARNWSQDQVSQWLKKIDMDQYNTLFMGKAINGEQLLELDTRELIRMGIDKKSHRNTILLEIKSLIT